MGLLNQDSREVWEHKLYFTSCWVHLASHLLGWTAEATIAWAESRFGKSLYNDNLLFYHREPMEYFVGALVPNEVKVFKGYQWWSEHQINLMSAINPKFKWILDLSEEDFVIAKQNLALLPK